VSAITVVSLACGLVYMAWASDLLIGRHQINVWLSGLRKEARQALGDTSQIPADAKIYFLWNGTTGRDYLTAALFLRPRPISPLCFSVRIKRTTEDRWSCERTPDELRALVQGYDLLFVGKADPQFWEEYGLLFPPGEASHHEGWFKIDVEGAQPFKPL
jgi:hypothetical protein